MGEDAKQVTFKKSLAVSYKSKYTCTTQCRNFTTRYLPKKTKNLSHTKTLTGTFRAALFVITKVGSIDSQMDKMYVHKQNSVQ